MNTIKCNHCRNYSIAAYTHQPDTMTIDGTLPYYKDGSKMYLTECCLHNYLAAEDNNNLITHEQRQEIYDAYKGSIYKTLMIHSDQYKVYELKPNKCLTFKVNHTQIKIARNISLNEYQGEYGIYTSTELKKVLKAMANPMNRVATDDTDMEINNPNACVYLLQDRVAITLNASVYKICKTTQPMSERIKAHAKGSEVRVQISCTNCHIAKAEILKTFKSKYIQRLDYDTESFEGDLYDMQDDINKIVKQVREL